MTEWVGIVFVCISKDDIVRRFKIQFMKLEVKVARTTVEANEVLGRPAKTLEYVIIGEGENRVIVQCGEKTYDGVLKMIEKAGTEVEDIGKVVSVNPKTK